MKGGSNGRSYPDLPAIEERVGYNPARFLLGSMPIEPLLKGETDIDALDAWKDAERKTANRDGVLERIQQRINAVEIGERGFVQFTDGPETPVDGEAPETPRERADDQADQAAVPDGGRHDGAQAAPDDASSDETDDAIEIGPCPDCGSEQTTTHELGGKRALWCRSCSNYVGKLD